MEEVNVDIIRCTDEEGIKLNINQAKEMKRNERTDIEIVSTEENGGKEMIFDQHDNKRDERSNTNTQLYKKTTQNTEDILSKEQLSKQCGQSKNCKTRFHSEYKQTVNVVHMQGRTGYGLRRFRILQEMGKKA